MARRWTRTGRRSSRWSPSGRSMRWGQMSLLSRWSLSGRSMRWGRLSRWSPWSRWYRWDRSRRSARLRRWWRWSPRSRGSPWSRWSQSNPWKQSFRSLRSRPYAHGGRVGLGVVWRQKAQRRAPDDSDGRSGVAIEPAGPTGVPASSAIWPSDDAEPGQKSLGAPCGQAEPHAQAAPPHRRRPAPQGEETEHRSMTRRPPPGSTTRRGERIATATGGSS
jgi:hypothetical protein